MTKIMSFFPHETQDRRTDPQAIAIIVREVMDDLVGQLSSRTTKRF